MCPLYVTGLIGPGDRKSVGPMAERVAPGDYDRLHHFVSDGVWDEAPLERELAIQADKLVGGAGAFLVIDDTTLPKKGTHSVGVAPQYASALGKTANCQTLVSLTLARGEVPVMVGLRLFLPETWTGDEARLDRAGVPAEYRSARTKSEIALAELDRLIAAGVRFGAVLAHAGLPGQSAFPVIRRSTRATSNSSSPSPRAAARANAMCPRSSPSALKTCSPKRNGARSPGARERRDL